MTPGILLRHAAGGPLLQIEWLWEEIKKTSEVCVFVKTVA